jgi:hypothetical protein
MTTTDPKPYPADLYAGCPCFECDQAPRIAAAKTTIERFPNRMSVCPTCGSKRCPGADHHDRHKDTP